MIIKRATVIRTRKPNKNAAIEFVGGVAVCSEDDLCIACVQWFNRLFGDDRRFDLIHIPNEARRSQWEARRIKDLGLRAGTPDYLVQLNGKPVGWLEFKFGKNTLSPEQKKFKDYVESGGFPFAVVRDFEEFKEALQVLGVYDPEKESELRASQIFKRRTQ